MTKAKPAKMSFLIAAILYTVYAIYLVTENVAIYLVTDNVIHDSFTVGNIISCIAALGMAATLFTKSKKAVVVAAGFNALLGAYLLIRFIISKMEWIEIIDFFDFISLWGDSILYKLFDFIAYAGAVVLIVLSIKGNAAIKKIWFLPAVALLLSSVARIIWLFDYIYDDIYDGDVWSFIKYQWTVLFDIVEVAALFFAGKWLKEDMAPAEAASVRKKAPSKPKQVEDQPILAASETGKETERLKRLKELFDAGVLTQEEFDAKKKQILGL